MQCNRLRVDEKPWTMQRVSPLLRFLCVEEEAWFCRL